MAVRCSAAVPRKSRPGPMQAQTEPHTKPCRSSSRRTLAGSMWEGSSIGISTVSNHHFLNVLNKPVLWVVNGDVNRNVLMPILISIWSGQEARATQGGVKQGASASLDCGDTSDTSPLWLHGGQVRARGIIRALSLWAGPEVKAAPACRADRSCRRSPRGRGSL